MSEHTVTTYLHSGVEARVKHIATLGTCCFAPLFGLHASADDIVILGPPPDRCVTVSNDPAAQLSIREEALDFAEECIDASNNVFGPIGFVGTGKAAISADTHAALINQSAVAECIFCLVKPDGVIEWRLYAEGKGSQIAPVRQ